MPKRRVLAIKRGKPVVADRNRAAAEENIRCKVQILASVALRLTEPVVDATDLVVEERLFSLGLWPRSIRQFNSWSSEALPVDIRKRCPAFFKNANATLSKYPGMLLSCQGSIGAMKAASSTRTRPLSSEDHLRVARQRLKLAQVVRQVAERELAAALVRLAELRDKQVLLLAQYSALERETNEAIELRDAEIADLKQRNAELTAANRKVIGLGVRRAK